MGPVVQGAWHGRWGTANGRPHCWAAKSTHHQTEPGWVGVMVGRAAGLCTPGTYAPSITKPLQTVTAAMKLKNACSLEGKL